MHLKLKLELLNKYYYILLAKSFYHLLLLLIVAYVALCGSIKKKKPNPSHGKSTKIPRGRGVLKGKNLEAKHEAQLEFPGGRGVQNKKPTVGGVWIFSGTAQYTYHFKGIGIHKYSRKLNDLMDIVFWVLLFTSSFKIYHTVKVHLIHSLLLFQLSSCQFFFLDVVFKPFLKNFFYSTVDQRIKGN